MKVCIGALFFLFPLSVSFTLQPNILFGSSLTTTKTCLFSSVDFEYIPPNPDSSPDEAPPSLSSAYPPGTPAGLRGEAVRSALLSGRCIGWNLGQEPALSMGGMLQVQGKGMRDFLNNKLSQLFPSFSSTADNPNDGVYQEACLLDGKGRAIDRLRVSMIDSETALILTSPGHSSQKLMDRLDPFIFPLDEIELTNLDCCIFTLASTQWKDVQKVLSEQALLADNPSISSIPVPTRADQSIIYNLGEDANVLVVPSTGLPSVSCMGYTLVFYGGNGEGKKQGQKIWEFLTGEANAEGPIEIGALEYETMRIEAGVPAYGSEIGEKSKISPLELHWQETISMEKGCYLGQEGVASIVKNPRGPPRYLYSVVFEDDFNVYETQSRGEKSKVENLTKPPKPGQKLFALGSNEELLVGTLTSVAEAGGTGERETVALGMIRRADSIMKQMNAMELEIPREADDIIDVDIDTGSGMIQPPPLDPLDGLEVIVEGTFTVGKLKGVPSRRFREGRSMHKTDLFVEDFEPSKKSSPTTQAEPFAETQPKKRQSTGDAEAEAAKAVAEAEEAAAEAKRKADKMEMLRKRAEAAMAKRKQNKGDTK